MNLSYWERKSYFTDIQFVIIGSGLVGLCTALALRKRHPTASILVLERSSLPSGASTKNAGFACIGSAGELLKDLEQYSENEVFGLVERRWKGLQKLRGLLGDTALAYEPCGGYELYIDRHLPDWEAIAYLNKSLRQLFNLDIYSDASPLIASHGFGHCQAMVHNSVEGLIDSGKTMKALIALCHQQNIEILNGVTVQSLENQSNGAYLCLADGFQFTAEKALICTNAFSKTLLPDIDLQPVRGQVLVTKPISNLKLHGGYHFQHGYYYFRHLADGRVLFGGGRNIDFAAEQTSDFGLTNQVQQQLHYYLSNIILPNSVFEVDYAWSGIMAFGSEQVPLVQQLAPNIYCAIKCQGMGVALGAQMADDLADLIE